MQMKVFDYIYLCLVIVVTLYYLKRFYMLFGCFFGDFRRFLVLGWFFDVCRTFFDVNTVLLTGRLTVWNRH